MAHRTLWEEGRHPGALVVSGVAAGAGLLMFLAAGTLFAIDEANDTPAPPPRAVAAPILGPDHVGARATLRF